MQLKSSKIFLWRRLLGIGQGMLDNRGIIYLYNDSCPPWKNKESKTKYKERLQALESATGPITVIAQPETN